MSERKWPMAGMIMLGILGLNALMATVTGARQGNFATLLSGGLMLFLLWNAYQFKVWAHKVLIFLFGLNCGLLILFVIAGGLPINVGLIGVAINLVFIFFFNSPNIKDLFYPQKSEFDGDDVADADYTEENPDNGSSESA